MKNIAKKLFIIAAIIIMMCIISVVASAETYGDLTYAVSNGKVTITGCSTSATVVEIPEKIDGYTVTSIGDYAFYGCSSLTSITILDGVTFIGNYAFEDCSSLARITIPDSVRLIGYYAFRDCNLLKKVYIESIESWLNISFNRYYSNPMFYGDELYIKNQLVTEITIPDSVTSIGDYAFYNCKLIEKITIPDSVINVGDYAFYNCNSLKKVCIESIESWLNIKFEDDTSNPMQYGADLYLNDKLITDLTIPDSITSIGAYTFYGCSSLSNIIIPTGVTSIGASAFKRCISLVSVAIPDSVVSIGSYAFTDCTALTSVYITDLAAWCKIKFGTDSINGSLSGNPLQYGALYINGVLTTEINIPDTVTYINSLAFYNCTSITSVKIPDSVTIIDRFAFKNCSSLTSVTIGNSVTNISYAFENCSSLTSVTIGNSVTNISYAFENCSSLTSVIIPDSITIIGDRAFYDCSSLTSIIIPKSVTNVGRSSFYDCNMLRNVLYKGTSAEWENISIDFFNSPLTSANYFYNINDNYLLIDNVLFNTNGTILIAYGANDRLYAVPNTVKSVEQNAFRNADALHTVILPQGLKNIGSYAFYSADNLTCIYIPAGISTIDTYAFYNCPNLTDVYFGGTQEQWNAITIGNNNTNLKNANIHFNSELVIEDGVIYNPDKTVLICYDKTDKSFTVSATVKTIGTRAFKNCKNLQQIILPAELEKLKSEAFYNCTALSEIVIPDSVTTIEASAFYGCTALQSVEFGDGLTTIGNSAFYGCTAIEKLTLPENLVSIGDSAFYGWTNLSEIYFPDSLESIGSSAFENCSALTYISLPDGLISLGSDVFRNCYALEKICLPESGHASIPANTFNGCSKLSDIYIPVNITSFGDSAFLGCNLLTDIYFSGTEEQWDNISIFSSNSVIWAANIHFEHEHTFGEWIELIPAEKYTDGLELSKCYVCSYEERRVIPCNHIHNYAYGVTTPATCVVDGLGTYTCECSLSYTEIIPATGHTFTNMTADEQHLASVATCCLKAKYYYKCENCNVFSTTDTFEFGEYNSQNHIGGTEIRGAYAEDCGNNGYTGDTYCLGCNAKIANGSVIPATGRHNYISSVITPATCNSTGLRTYTCTVCEDTYTDTIEIDTTNHTGGTEIRGAYAEDCDNNGYTGNTYCLGCNTKIANGSVIPATSRHNYTSSVTTPATCNSTGLRTYICTVCKDTYTETIEIDTTNHTGGTKIRFAYAEDCGNNGYTGDTYCLGCNAKIANGSVIPATGRHNYISSVITPATCNSTGLRTYTCTVCEDTYTDTIEIDTTNHTGGTEIRGAYAEDCGNNGYTGDTYCLSCNAKIADGSVIPATDKHNYSSAITTPATCKTTGVRTYTCTVCGDSYEEEIPVNANNHAGGTEVRNKKEATCTSDGYSGDVYCTGCNKLVSEGKTINMLGHTEIVLTGKSATCTETGITEGKKCSACGEILVAQKELPATGHTAGEWEVVVPAQVGIEGKEQQKCTVCGTVVNEREIPALEPQYILGDANGDGKITAADARIALRISAKLDKIEDFNLPLAALDVTGDEKLTAADARKILRISAKLE